MDALRTAKVNDAAADPFHRERRAVESGVGRRQRLATKANVRQIPAGPKGEALTLHQPAPRLRKRRCRHGRLMCREQRPDRRCYSHR